MNNVEHPHSEFDPANIGKDRLDPLAATDQPFDWGELESLLGETETLRDYEREKLVHVFTVILQWAVQSSRGRVDLRKIGRKLVALAWVINPASFDGSPAARELARRAGLHKSCFSIDCTDATRRFGIRNRPQRHGANFNA